MSASERDQSPEFTWCDDGGRPLVKPYIQASKFHVGDKVYFNSSGGSREGGPFIIASVPSAGMYTLSLENGQAVRHGEEVEESRLEAA